MGINTPDNKHSLQRMGNKSYDETYEINSVELWGEDSGTGVLRRNQLDSSGAQLVTESGSRQQLQFEYDVNNNPIYIGRNSQGVATSVATWVISKLTFDGNNNLIVRKTAVDSWDNRATATYS